MTKAIIYHNPRCTKSRQTLALLEERELEIEIIEYLKNPPNKTQLKKILKLLNIKPRQLLRTKEAEYQLCQLNDENKTNDEILTCMLQYPKLIERPIVIIDEQAVIGRPPENVLELLPA